MAQITLSYFDMAASRGEECRLALTLAGVDFVDDRIRHQDWSTRKASTPFGAVPVLQVEGKGVLAHSNAILTYIGTQYGLRPSDPFEAALHDGVMEAVEELRTKMWALLREGTTAEEKAVIRSAFAQGPLLTWAAHMQAQVRGPFVCGDKIQVADLKVWAICQWLFSGVIDHISTDALAPFEKLVAVHRNVAQNPQVAAFRARHAKTVS